MVMGIPGDGSGSSGIQLTNLPSLELVNAPRLTYIPSLLISNFTRSSFDFSGLMSAYSIEISGDSISEYVTCQFLHHLATFGLLEKYSVHIIGWH